MHSTSVPALQPQPAEQGAERAAQRKASIITVLGLTAAFGGALGLWLWTRADEASAIRDIPRAQQAELYDSTRRALLAACVPGQRPPALEDYCDAQSRFIQQFEQCDDACRELARRASRQPRR